MTFSWRILIFSSQYNNNNTIIFCALLSEWSSKLASGSRCCPACAPRSTPAARSSGDTPPRELSTKFHENITIFVGGTKATHSIERRFKQGGGTSSGLPRNFVDNSNLDTILAELRDGLLFRQAAAAVLQRGEHLPQQWW